MTTTRTKPDSPRIPCVGAVVRDENGRLLLIRRGTDPGHGQWSIPGGRVKDGETGEVAVAREVREETGLIVTVGAAVGTIDRPGRDGATYVITDYVCHLASPSLPTVAGDDVDSAAWVSDDELSSYDIVDGLLDALREWGLLTRVGRPA